MPRDALVCEAWNGRVPVAVHLARDECTAHEPPAPFLALLPRMSYLSQFETDIRSHFFEAIAPIEDGIWFEYHGAPLKWHLPIGVVFDSCCASQLRRVDASSPAALPWSLTVHFQAFPEAVMPRCRSLDALRTSFFHTLKQSVWLRCGSARPLTDMSKLEHASIWDAARQGSMDVYSAAVAPLFAVKTRSAHSGDTVPDMEAVLTSTEASSEAVSFGAISSPIASVSSDDSVVSIPAQVIIDASDPYDSLSSIVTGATATTDAQRFCAAPTPTSWLNVPVRVVFTNATSSNVSSLSSLSSSLPSPPTTVLAATAPLPLFSQLPITPFSNSRNAPISVGLALAQLHPHLQPAIFAHSVRAVVHGADIPLDAPLAEIAAALAHADGFLYIIIVEERTMTE